ncbi:tetratricopeptide repeat protein [Streptacidiphilus fuscans]|uniref:Tetratricopeptide repeat protein n=1 Tax=Streptacidiphilus fuscans TaxID=2789292 RepID=A0A931BA49_9ACTN|nr:tetratricopeptide repeat protein [Streptacidiphilus fuscans]MBF9070538.1 tetratricopeptide repeat protein [Streptacidiphilus fuscans]
MRDLRGDLSPREFAASVRRAAREIGEHVSCDARYVGRVESGEIRCPNYAYERVFRHMFPGAGLAELGFTPRAEARRRPASAAPPDEENDDVQRRTFLTGGPLAVATALSWDVPAQAAAAGAAGDTAAPAAPVVGTKVGAREVHEVESAVRQIRLLDDVHGADTLFERAGDTLRSAYQLLNCGSYTAQVEQQLQTWAGELAISVGWLAHDSGRLGEARSLYAEALATARMAGDAALEAHAFCNTAFLARDAGRPRESVRAAQAARTAAAGLGSPRLLALLALREAGGWALLRDRGACVRALGEARSHFEAGTSEADPEWMTFFNEGELAGLTAQCWAAMGEFDSAARWAEQAITLQPTHFVRNRALYTAELAHDELGRGSVVEAARTGSDAIGLLTSVRSTRIRGMVSATAERMRSRGLSRVPEVADFLERYQLALAS